MEINNSTRRLVLVFGILVALVGAEHGVGALLQGNVKPTGIVFESWPNAPSFEILSGEPALTLIPNLFGAGVATLLVCVALIIWCIVSVHRRLGAVGLLVLFLTLLVVGGGFGPPLAGLVLSAAASRIRADLSWWRKRSQKLLRRIAGFWPLFFSLSLAGYLFLFPGLVLLTKLTDFAYEPAVLIAAGASFGFLILAAFAGLARDALSRGPLEEDSQA